MHNLDAMFSFTNIADYHEKLISGETNCVTAVDHYLQQINANRHLNAFTEVYGDEALVRAAALDEMRKSGMPLKKLHGVVVAIKDVICYKDHRVTAASKMLKGFTSLYTATALQLLIDEEAIIIGSCNCDEFAMGSTNENSAYGPVKNALDETRVPGGSSGGSAVAVQAHMCMLSLGSDTGGSVRQPADFCGISGLKPGYGRISRYGLIAYASSFDQIGIFGRDFDDINLLLRIMSAPDSMDSTMDQYAMAAAQPVATDKKWRIAFFKQATEHAGIDPEIAEKINQLQNDLSDAGHEVRSIDLDLLDVVVPAYYVLTTAEASSNLGRYDGIRYGHVSDRSAPDTKTFYVRNRTEGFGAEVKEGSCSARSF